MMKPKVICMALLVLIVLPAVRAIAGDRPVITLAQGEVMILASPQSTPHAEAPKGWLRSKFDGRHYLSRKAAVGDSVELESWVRTLPGGRARLVYPNGDQLNVGPGSFFRIEAQKGPAKGQSREGMTFDYGMVRAIISKSGPRSGLRIRTPSAVMGVRGTDFVVEQLGSQQSTALTLIRGSVELKAKGTEVVQEVKTGETAIAEKAKAPEKFPTSQTELKRALVLTEKAPTAEAKPAEVPAEVAEKLQKLEAQARDTTVKDMVQYARTPEEKARLEKLASSGADIQKINATAVELRVEEAPKDSPGLRRIIEETKKLSKRTEVDLKELEKDPYQKYFDSTQDGNAGGKAAE